MTTKVSVVVPVFNPGPYMEPCIESLLAQTMPAGELELIFVDDASYDDSFARLQELEANHPQVRAITIERSGWPGKPRNVGTEAASGEYVMYVDQDDRLDPESLQRMYDLGSANGADIVLGKVTSDFRGVHQYLYREERPRCTVYDSRLINSQTPHKMLRRQFMIDHDLRYPEGRRRLEDQLFITRAYFAAQSCSIVADYVCYRYLRRPDGGNAGSWRINPEQYFQNLREVLDVVDAAVEPGPIRDQFYRRFLRVEMLGKLSGRRVRNYPLDVGSTWLREIRTLLEERFSLSVDEGLPGLARTRAHLARHATFPELQDLTERTREVQPRLQVNSIAAGGDGAVDLKLEGRFEIDGEPLRLESDGAGGWLIPASLVGDIDPALRRAEDVSTMMADAVIVDRELGDEWFLRPPLRLQVVPSPDGGHVQVSGTVRLDPASAAGGRPLSSGLHDVLLRVEALGLSRTRRVEVDPDSAVGAVLPGVIAREPRTLLKASDAGRLLVAVDTPAKSARRLLSPVRATWQEDRLDVRLAGAWWATSELRASLTRSDGARVNVRLRRDADDPRRWVSSTDALRSGTYEVRLHLKGSGSITDVDRLVVPRSAPRILRVGRRRAVTVWGAVTSRLRQLWRPSRPDS